MKIYVASSWLNKVQPVVISKLKEAGFDVYDFRHPTPDDSGFYWSEIDKDWKYWTSEQFVKCLKHPIAESGYNKDMYALNKSDVVILVMPCGRSAHLEFGYAVGRCKHTAILLCDGEPELMYKMASMIFTNIPTLLSWVKHQEEVIA